MADKFPYRFMFEMPWPYPLHPEDRKALYGSGLIEGASQFTDPGPIKESSEDGTEPYRGRA